MVNAVYPAYDDPTVDWRERYADLNERTLWTTTALSAAMAVLHAPEVEAILSDAQRRAVARIDAGPDAPLMVGFAGVLADGDYQRLEIESMRVEQ